MTAARLSPLLLLLLLTTSTGAAPEETELARALARGADVETLRSEPGIVATMRHSNCQVAFRSDGRLLAFDSGNWIYLLEVGSWKPAGRIRCEASVSALM